MLCKLSAGATATAYSNSNSYGAGAWCKRLPDRKAGIPNPERLDNYLKEHR